MLNRVDRIRHSGPRNDELKNWSRIRVVSHFGLIRGVLGEARWIPPIRCYGPIPPSDLRDFLGNDWTKLQSSSFVYVHYFK
jgi:hypothetical protein